MMTLITRAGTLSQGIFERLLQSRVKKAITCRSGAFALRIVGTWYRVANVLLQPACVSSGYDGSGYSGCGVTTATTTITTTTTTTSTTTTIITTTTTTAAATTTLLLLLLLLLRYFNWNFYLYGKHETDIKRTTGKNTHTYPQRNIALCSVGVKPKLVISPFMLISCGSEATVLK